jgi:hypothetical protein
MNTSTECERDSYRLLIIRRNATELLLTIAGCKFSLPAVEIPRWERAAPLLTAAVKDLGDFEAHSLFTLSTERPLDGVSRIRYQVMESSVPNRKSPRGWRWYWVLVSSLCDKSFADSEDYRAIRSATAELEGYASGLLHGPFGKPSWIRGVFEWVEREIAPLGLRITGRFRQLNASPTFSLIRMETNGPAIWFKAVGEPNLREYPITLTLAKLFPAFVPKIIATRSDWNAWLVTETEGTHPDESSEIATWMTVAKRLADLQLASFGQTLHLIDAGCRDARICSLLELVEPFLEVMAGLMEQQTKASPAPLSRTELRTLGAQLQDVFSHFNTSAIPHALGHLDFNAGNILVFQNQCAFLDWAEACVGHPFVTFQYLVEYLRRYRPSNTSWEPALTSAYVESWRSFVDPDEISAAVAAAPLLAVFTYAAAGGLWRNPDRLAHPDTAKHLRSLTRRTKREADRWAIQRPTRSVPCLS